MACIQVREKGQKLSQQAGKMVESPLISMNTPALGFEFHLQGSMGFEISLSSNFIIPSGQYQYPGTVFFVALK